MTRWTGRSGISKVKFDTKSIVILWFEILMFAMIYGRAFRSWLVFGIIFFGSAVLMYVPKRTVYIIIAVSFLWGFIAFSIGHSLSWGWAMGLGMTFLLLGIRAHLSGLKQPLKRLIFWEDKNIDNWCWSRQNLN